MIIGTAIGIVMGCQPTSNALFDPLLVLLLILPALVTIILMYVWFGLVEVAAVMAVVIDKVPNVAVTVREGARSLDYRLEEMATVYEFTRWQRLREVWVPQLFRSEEHTSELQSRPHLVCRLLLEKKKKKTRSSVIASTYELIAT